MGLLGELIPLILGIYLFLLFTGILTPNFRNEEQKIKFEQLKTNHSGKIKFLAIFLIAIGLYGIGRLFSI